MLKIYHEMIINLQFQCHELHQVHYMTILNQVIIIAIMVFTMLYIKHTGWVRIRVPQTLIV